jgi:hypothetical protein
MLESSLAVLTTNIIRLLLNKLFRSHVSSDNNKVVNAFTSRSMPLRRPKSKQVLCIDLYHYLLLDSFKVYAYEYISVRVTLTLVSGLFVIFIASLDLQETPY